MVLIARYLQILQGHSMTEYNLDQIDFRIFNRDVEFSKTQHRVMVDQAVGSTQRRENLGSEIRAVTPKAVVSVHLFALGAVGSAGIINMTAKFLYWRRKWSGVEKSSGLILEIC
ncbi:hypothetical protein BGX24_002179 [Mortierella sp. AD032]|nr:hypothetical protein BGX24_002179 [Mortierella sp. AD032]